MPKEVMFDVMFESNKDTLLNLLNEFYKYLKNESSDAIYTYYLENYIDLVKKAGDDKVVIRHSDYRELYESKGKEDKADSLSSTNIKKFNEIEKHLKTFNRKKLKNKEYCLDREGIFIRLIKNPTFLEEKLCQAKNTIEALEHNEKRDDIHAFIKDKKITETNQQGNFEKVLMSLIEILKEVFTKVFPYFVYTVVSPKKMTENKVRNATWIIMGLIIIAVMNIILAYFVSKNYIFIINFIIPILIYLFIYCCGYVPDELLQIINDKNDIVVADFNLYYYTISAIIFSFYSLVFFFSFHKIFKSKIVFGQVLYINSVVISLYLIVLQFLLLRAFPFSHLSITTELIITSIIFSLYLGINGRAQYHFSEIKRTKFLIMFLLIHLSTAVFGIFMFYVTIIMPMKI